MTDFYIRQGDTAWRIDDVLRDENGDAVDIAGANVKLQLAPLRGGALKIDAAAVNDQVGDGLDGSRGKVHYSGGASDAADAGDFLGTWIVTFEPAGSAKTLSFPNAGYILVTVTGDPPTSAGRYLTLEEAKRTLKLEGRTFADRDIEVAIVAASRGLEAEYGGPWTLSADANEARYFTPFHGLVKVDLGSLVELTEVALDTAGGGTYSTILVQGTDYRLEPVGSGPWDRLRFLRSGIAYDWKYDPRSSPFPWGIDSLRITGRWGYATAPEGVKAATSIIATRILRRMREAPFGGAIGLGLEGAVVRAGQLAKDPEVSFVMKAPRKKRRLVV